MSPDLFMELLYDFVTGVAPVQAEGHTSIHVLDYASHAHRFYVDVAPRVPGCWVMLCTGRVRIHYSLGLDQPHAAEEPGQAVTSVL